MRDNQSPYRIAHGAVVLLAAGASRRLGRPKQLLPLGNATLLQHAAQVASGIGWQPVLVVVSPEQTDSMAALLKDLPVQIISNEAWQEGMAASIRCGISYLQAHFPACDGAMLMVCDQPYITEAVLQQLFQQHQLSAKPVAAAFYANRPGTPALFHYTWFTKLLELEGDTGARKLLMNHANEVALFDFPDGIIDIDTPEDIHHLKA